MSNNILLSPVDRALLLDDWQRGNMDIEAIADDYGVTVSEVYQIIREELGVANTPRKDNHGGS